MRIRRAELPDDAAAILAIQRSGYAIEAELAHVPSLPPQEQTADDLLRETLWVADSGGEIAGVLAVEDGPEPLIAKLVVDPGRLRQGIGRALVNHALALAGWRPVRVGTASANAPALALYESLGFVRVGERTVGGAIAFTDLRREGGE